METQPYVLMMYQYLVVEAKRCNDAQFWKMYLQQGICQNSMLCRLAASTAGGDDDDHGDNGGGDGNDDGGGDDDNDDDNGDDDDDDDDDNGNDDYDGDGWSPYPSAG